MDVLKSRRVSWQLQDIDTTIASELMRIDGVSECDRNDPLRVFLYAKGIVKDLDPIDRKRSFDELLNPTNDLFSEIKQKYLARCKERLSSIVLKCEGGKESIPKSENQFDRFVRLNPQWGAGKSFVSFRDDARYRDKPQVYAERVQLSGLCHMHAPVIMQHYLVALQSSERVEMLDMATYMKKYMSAEDLQQRIWQDQGGSSVAFLRHILSPPVPKLHPRDAVDEMESYLRSFGPGLVSCFQVDYEFESQLSEHIGPRPQRDILGLHAMVLVGARKLGDQYRYLLQNWWASKPFVEVDGEYLSSCGAFVYFVETPQYKIYSSFPTSNLAHVECDVFFDAQESYQLEN
ncbi:hypothetical protein MIR68_000840 [Amoeboaphelidium protococcarum]|nr:hypothetical protein MIR68_000840 [Amoeboaphelidium protococcarum]